MATTFLSATITRRSDDTSHLRRFWLRPSEPFTFTPGQYCTIGYQGVERPYSIASVPGDPEIELFVEKVDEGELTPRLYRAEVGTEVTLRPRAKGKFVFDESRVNHVMVATVTGIAPFVSMLRTRLAGDHPHRFWVLHGASYVVDLVYSVELHDLEIAWPDRLNYIPSCSRPADPSNEDWTGLVGRVNLLVEGLLERDHLELDDTIVYACGNPGMVADVHARLAPGGWKVREERYWVESGDIQDD
jgi:ferredoxin--NADP+ reductase